MAIFGKKDNKKTEDTSTSSAQGKKVEEKEVKKTTVKKAITSPKETPAGKETAKKFGIAYKVLVKPLVTEKVASQTENGKYVFEVSKGSNKIEIAKAIKEVYGAKVTKVNIINMEGKRKRVGRTIGRRKDWKKAIVTLEKGKTIKVYEGV